MDIAVSLRGRNSRRVEPGRQAAFQLRRVGHRRRSAPGRHPSSASSPQGQSMSPWAGERRLATAVSRVAGVARQAGEVPGAGRSPPRCATRISHSLNRTVRESTRACPDGYPAPVVAGAGTLPVGTETSAQTKASMSPAWTKRRAPWRTATGAAIANPGFLAPPAKHRLYAVTESQTADGSRTEAVAAFAVCWRTGALNSSTPACRRHGHLAVDASGRVAAAGQLQQRQRRGLPPRARTAASAQPAQRCSTPAPALTHSARRGPTPWHLPRPDRRRAYGPTSGLDQVLITGSDPATGRFAQQAPHARTEPGGGPRHMAFHPSGRFAYVNLEMSSRVALPAGCRDGRHDVDTSAVDVAPGATVPGSTAETLVRPSGRFLCLERGHDSIAVFAVNEQDGTLRFIETTPTG